MHGCCRAGFTVPNHCLLFHKKPVPVVCVVISGSKGELHLAMHAHATKIPAGSQLAAQEWSITCGGSRAEASSTKTSLPG